VNAKNTKLPGPGVLPGPGRLYGHYGGFASVILQKVRPVGDRNDGMHDLAYLVWHEVSTMQQEQPRCAD
jgi:hypothetical protein